MEQTNQINQKVISPINGDYLGQFKYTTKSEYDTIVNKLYKSFLKWRSVPAPQRGELVRKLGNRLRENKEVLAELLTLEVGKIKTEALGEVQEMIDICDYAVGLSRQIGGLGMSSERVNHRMNEQYHPLGIVAIITAFNFPLAVWAWNAIIGLVTGNTILWKPSEKATLVSIKCHEILNDLLNTNDLVLSGYVLGNFEQGKMITSDTRIALVSATGSTNMGRSVAMDVTSRFGKYLLELGGNNALIITPSANLNNAIKSTLFGFVGTSGQRCTTTRRLIVHKDVYDEVKTKLIELCKQIKIGDPRNSDTLMGPLIDSLAVNNYLDTINYCKSNNYNICYGGNHIKENYVQPTIIEAPNNSYIVQKETFAPILYLIQYEGNVHNAIDIQNDSLYGLSSSIYTDSVTESELFTSVNGSDCGIANVNVGTSGAEIGGAFGGEKWTGGGREAGSDCWKYYMRRQTNSINYGSDTVLAQGVLFDL